MKKTLTLVAALWLLTSGLCVGLAETAGTLDNTFAPVMPSTQVSLWGLAFQSNGSVLASGRVNLTPSISALYLFNTNGDAVPGFLTGANATCPGVNTIPQINTLLYYTNNGLPKILLGGAFTWYNDGTISQQRPTLAQLDPFGHLDASFKPVIGNTQLVNMVNAYVIQPDGKIIIGGNFTNVQNSRQNYIARINQDGNLDTSFNAGTGANATVRTVVLQPDGKILLGGDFTTVNGQSCSKIARLKSDGGVDVEFTPPVVEDTVYAIAVQPSNNKILIGGIFLHINGENHSYLARLGSDGTFDANYPATCDGNVYSIVFQNNGRFLIGGRFNSAGGRAKIARFTADGLIDVDFNATAGSGTLGNDEVRAIKIQDDGKIIIAGKFTTFNGAYRNGLARLFGDPVGVPTLLPPTHVTIPSQIASLGSNVTFTVTSNGDQPLTYQWFFNNSILAGATATNLSLANVQMTNSGTYSVTVSNSAGSTNAQAMLRVRPSPSAILASSDQTIQISFPYAPGQTNILQTCTNLTVPTWISIATNPVDATLTKYIYTDTNRCTQRFYRILVP